MTLRRLVRRLTRRWRPIEFWLSDPIVAAALEDVDLDAVWPLHTHRVSVDAPGGRASFERRTVMLACDHGPDHNWEYRRDVGMTGCARLVLHSHERRTVPDLVIDAPVGRPLATLLAFPGASGVVVSHAEQHDDKVMRLAWTSLDLTLPMQEA
jgi:hypothetical protein